MARKYTSPYFEVTRATAILLRPNEYVISADEKTSIQARNRKGLSTPVGPNRCRRLEFEYQRCGALAYLAAWDVRRAKVFGLCEPKGIDAYRRLVDLCQIVSMVSERYSSPYACTCQLVEPN
ncbi:hypothetical protein ACFL0M_11750 [Thermodesulfobacteriota bacterium]